MGDPRGEALDRAEDALKDLDPIGVLREQTHDGGESGRWWVTYRAEPAEGYDLDDVREAVADCAGDLWTVAVNVVEVNALVPYAYVTAESGPLADYQDAEAPT